MIYTAELSTGKPEFSGERVRTFRAVFRRIPKSDGDDRIGFIFLPDTDIHMIIVNVPRSGEPETYEESFRKMVLAAQKRFPEDRIRIFGARRSVAGKGVFGDVEVSENYGMAAMFVDKFMSIIDLPEDDRKTLVRNELNDLVASGWTSKMIIKQKMPKNSPIISRAPTQHELDPLDELFLLDELYDEPDQGPGADRYSAIVSVSQKTWFRILSSITQAMDVPSAKSLNVSYAGDKNERKVSVVASFENYSAAQNFVKVIMEEMSRSRMAGYDGGGIPGSVMLISE